MSNERIPQVLLYGNGINQLGGGLSWNMFLEQIADDSEMKEKIKELDCPEPLKAILVTRDHVDVAMKNYCKEIAFQEPTGDAREMCKKILEIGFDEILTTNYTYEMEMTSTSKNVINEKTIKNMMRYIGNGKKAENKYLLHTYNLLTYNGKENHLWHIHGEARKPDSTILGHYYYGNLLYKMKDYVDKRNYERHREVKSWIDAFILGDVYILGFGMGFSEMDLWWLLNRKAREKTPNGKVYFYEAEPARYNEKHELLHLMKRAIDEEPLVEIVTCGYKNKIVIDGVKTYEMLDGKYTDFYVEALENIKKKVLRGRRL